MFTVIDQQSAWLTPNNALATMIQPQAGAHRMSSGTGMPTSQPATSTPLRPTRSERLPATTLVSALTTPKATMKESAALAEAIPN